MGRYKDHSPFRGSRRKQNSPRTQRKARDEGRVRGCICFWCEAFQRQVENQSLPQTTWCFVPLSTSRHYPSACFWRICHLFVVLFSDIFFPHIEFSNDTLVAKIIRTCVIKSLNCTTSEIPLEMNILMKYTILTIYRGVVYYLWVDSKY